MGGRCDVVMSPIFYTPSPFASKTDSASDELSGREWGLKGLEDFMEMLSRSELTETMQESFQELDVQI